MSKTKLRTRGTKEEYEIFPEKVKELKDFFTKMESKHSKPLSQVSITNYTNKLNRLSTLVQGKGYDGDNKWLFDAEKVIGKLVDSNVSGKKDFITPVVRLLKELDAPQETIALYQKAMSKLKEAEDVSRKGNVATKKDVETYIPLPQIIKSINDYKPKDDMELIYKLICSLYFQNTLVPRNDLPTMKFVSASKKSNQMNPEFNYITLDKNNTPIDIIMNNYKSKNTYGRQKFPIKAEPRELLKQYIKSYNKKAGDWLFQMRDGKPFQKPNFIDLIGNATEAVLGKRLTIDLIRRLQITDYYNGNVKSIAEDEADAKRFLHSTNVHKEYLRLGVVKDDED